MEKINEQNVTPEELNKNLNKFNKSGTEKVLPQIIKTLSHQDLSNKTHDEVKLKPFIKKMFSEQNIMKTTPEEQKVTSNFIKRSSEQNLITKRYEEDKAIGHLKKRFSEINVIKKKQQEKVVPRFVKQSSQQNLNKKKCEEVSVIARVLKMMSAEDADKKQEETKVPLNIFKKSVEAAMKINYMKFKEHDADLKLKQEQFNEVKKAIQMFPYFRDWHDDVIMEGCNLSKIENFQPNVTILGDGKGERNFVYFILEGMCQMVQDLRIATSYKRKQKHFHLISGEKEEEPRANERTATYFMQVCIMDKGECFGIGEDLAHRRIIALTQVKCLLCPRHWMVEHTQANIWERIKQFLNRNLPDKEQLFQTFVDQHRWLDYRRKVIREISHCKTNNTTIHDVPYSIRITQARDH